jgi:pyruvate dehydrogenase E2 component (dihydrolipoamide acetyltransferase)
MATAVIMPKLEISQETGTVIEWLKEEGDEVEKGEPILVVETDKVTVETEAPASGILADKQVSPGDIVPVTEVIAYILEPGEPSVVADESPTPAAEQAAPSTTRGLNVTPVAERLAEAEGVDLETVMGTGRSSRITKADVEKALQAPAPRTPKAPEGKVRASPAARRLAREQDLDLQDIQGTGPRGRIQGEDVRTFAAAKEAAESEVVPEPAAQVIPLEGMRRTIAERMTSSYQTSPHISFTVRVDMTNFQRARAALNARAEASDGSRVSTTALLLKAVAWALQEHPWLNSTLEEDEIHLLPEINIGVAVALERGLIVPVVREANRKRLEVLATELDDLVSRAREGQLTPSDVTGGTFTVSNLGPFGIESFNAIINPPEAAILAVGATQQELAVGEDGKPVSRPVMRMTVSVDHRIVDGALAARFLATLREALEEPSLLLW